MNFKLLFALPLFAMACSGSDDIEIEPVPPVVDGNDIELLIDGSLETVYESDGASISFITQTEGKVAAYSFYAAESQSNENDPNSWVVYGSNDKNEWTEVDKRGNIDFWARFQERYFALEKVSNYKYLKFVVQPKDATKLRLAELKLHAEDVNSKWTNFQYPLVPFVNEDEKSVGSKYYDYLVQNKSEYLKFHAREVAKILYYDADDARKDIQQIKYILKDYDGISAKSGNIPSVQITYSTRYIAQAYQLSMFKLDHETRGVLFHEMTHCYQYEPQNCGTYNEQGVFWAFMEGLADAVRIHAGYVDMKERRQGGWYTDGYKTTGFFLDWLTTKDPDAIRKFNRSAKELSTWSFDGAMKYIFGSNASVRNLWVEYQNYLKTI